MPLEIASSLLPFPADGVAALPPVLLFTLLPDNGLLDCSDEDVPFEAAVLELSVVADLFGLPGPDLLFGVAALLVSSVAFRVLI